MKINVSFDSGDFGRNLQRQVEAIKQRELDARVKRLAGRRCRQHNKRARVSHTLDGFAVDACCQEFAAEVRQALAK